MMDDTFTSFIIKHQNLFVYNIVTKGFFMMDGQQVVGASFLDFLQDHLSILKHLSTENLIHLFSMKNHAFAGMRLIFDDLEVELMRRLDLDPILQGNSLSYYINFKGKKENTFALNGMSSDHIAQVTQQIRSSISDLKCNYSNDYERMQGRLNFRTVQNFLLQLKQFGFSEEKYGTIDRIVKENRHILDAINYGVFADGIYQLGEDFVCLLVRYPNVCKQVIELNQTYPQVMSVIGGVISQYSSSSSFLYHQILEMTIDYLYQQVDLTVLESLSVSDIVSMALLSSSFKEDCPMKSFDSFMDDCDRRFAFILSEYHSIDDLKDIYCMKYFGISLNKVLNILKHYDLMRSDMPILHEMKMIISVDDEAVLKEKYVTNRNSFTALDVLQLEDQLRGECAQSYVDGLADMDKIIRSSHCQMVSYRGSFVKVIEVDSDFCLIAHSTDSQIVVQSKEVGKNLRDGWNNPLDPQTRLVASFYIDQDNFRAAPLGENGVYMGFTQFSSEQIEMVSNHDMHSRLGEMSAVSFQDPMYVRADEMSLWMRKGWSEINHQIVDPNYIVLFDDMTLKQKEQAYEAALQWQVPILSIPKKKLITRQLQKQSELMKCQLGVEDVSDVIGKLVNSFESLSNSLGVNHSGAELPDFMKDQKFQIECFIGNYLKQIACFPDQLVQVENILKRELLKYEDMACYNRMLPDTKSCLNIDGMVQQISKLRQVSGMNMGVEQETLDRHL